MRPIDVDPGDGGVYPPIVPTPTPTPGPTPTPAPTPTPSPTPTPPPPVPSPTLRVPSALAAVVQSLASVVIPLSPVSSQTMAVALGSQACRIEVYQKTTGLFLNLYVADRPIVIGVLCRDRNVLVIDEYLGFIGDLTFYDTQARQDPSYEGLGSRWQLVWLDARTT